MPENDVEIDLSEIFRILRRRIRVLVGCVFLVTVAVVLVSYQLTPLYTATAQVLIDPRERNVTDLEAVVSGLSADSSTVESQVEVFRSRSLATPVIEAMRLKQDPEFNPALREPGVLASAVHWIRSLAPGQVEISERERSERETSRVFGAFSKALEVSRLGRLSFVISVSFTSEDRAKAARIANAVADQYLVDQLDAKFEATRRANQWLDQRLAPLREQLRESERAVEMYRAQHDLVDASDGTTVDEQQLLEVSRQLVQARAELAEKQARFQRVRNRLPAGGGFESVAEVLDSDVIAGLRQQQAELARKQAELMSRYEERHPRMINVRAEGRDLQRELAAEVNRIVANLENEVEVAKSRDRSLTESLAQLQHDESVRERARVRLRELKREVAANRAVYEPFLSRFKETREQQSDQQADARIISQAPVPVDPSYPNMPLNAALGFVMAALIGLGAVFLLERFDDGFHTVRQLEVDLQLPHLGSIPELTKAQAEAGGEAPSPEDYTLAKPLSAYSEALRGLRAKLLLADDPPKLILFTSALPSEGKTTTTISLGRAAAQAGMRVLVIDGDLRNPSVARDLGKRPEAGLVEFLAGQEPLSDVLFLDEPSGMHVLPVASGTANPPDLLGSTGMRDMLEKLKSDFDLILMDSPPVLAVADARVLGRVADSVVFITQWETTPRGAAQEAVRALHEFGVKVTGVVLSRLDTSRYASYGYGDYNYHSRYSDYYVD